MAAYYEQPLKLVWNKLVRYPGGREIDRFRGIYPGADDGRPEAWVGSCARVINAAQLEDKNEGMAKVNMPDGSVIYVQELIDMDPAHVLGAEHAKKYGNNSNLLVKLLDAEKQLRLQAHPTRERAKNTPYFNHADFGKTECWYIISLREDSPVKPYLLLGFKEGITREIYDDLYDKEDVPAMENWCHKIYPQPGEMYFVQSGLVHAVGTGCFMVEIQEPSDFTVGVVKNPDYPGGPEEWKERELGTYHYDGCSYEENLRRWKVEPKILRETENGKEVYLIGSDQTPFFGGVRYELTGEFAPMDTGTFSINIVTDGEGKILYDGGEMEIQKADEIFLPAGVKNLRFVPAEGSRLEIVRCLPPDCV